MLLLPERLSARLRSAQRHSENERLRRLLDSLQAPSNADREDFASYLLDALQKRVGENERLRERFDALRAEYALNATTVQTEYEEGVQLVLGELQSALDDVKPLE